MVQVGLGVAEVEVELRGFEGELSIAGKTSPRTTVIAGSPSAMAQVRPAGSARSVLVA